jgi:hypothetical protein
MKPACLPKYINLYAQHSYTSKQRYNRKTEVNVVAESTL